MLMGISGRSNVVFLLSTEHATEPRRATGPTGETGSTVREASHTEGIDAV